MKLSIKNITLFHALPYILLVGSLVALFSATVLTVEHIRLIKNPDIEVSCDLNPVVSCGAVDKAGGTLLFDIPNALLGVMAYSALAMFAVLLATGARFPKWIFWGLQAGVTGGFFAVHGLLFFSVYSINAICPYCIVEMIATITMFWYVTLYNIRHGYITLHRHLVKPGEFARRHHLDILIFWLLFLTVLILNHFWYYYGPKLGF